MEEGEVVMMVSLAGGGAAIVEGWAGWRCFWMRAWELSAWMLSDWRQSCALERQSA